MADDYVLWLTDDRGVRLRDVDGRPALAAIQSFTATRNCEGRGEFICRVPPEFYPGWLHRDNMIQVWRAPRGGILRCWQVYFLRRWRYEDEGAGESLMLHAFCPRELMRRRVQWARPGLPESQWSGSGNAPVDDIMKAIVRYNFIDSGQTFVPSVSHGSSYRFLDRLSVDVDRSQGPTINAEYDLLDPLFEPPDRGVLGDLQKRSGGPSIFWDVVIERVESDYISFRFITHVDQPGIDRTDLGVMFSRQRRNLHDASLEYDYREEVTYTFNVRYGNQYTTTAYGHKWSEPDHNASIWNRIERSAKKGTTSSGGLLSRGRGRVRFEGTLIDTPRAEFQRDWDFGDKIRIGYRGYEFNAIVRAVAIQIDDEGEETIRAHVEEESKV